MEKISGPFLRWAGSKRKLIPILKTYWKEDFGRYFEPFMGSAQLFYAIQSSKGYIISDKNSDLVQTYIQIQKYPYEVYKVLRTFTNSKDEYYRLRALDSKRLGRNQKAARFIYLNWLCFNGLYRTNNKGIFNVPYSGDQSKSLDNWDILRNASRKLENAIIIEGDFEDVIKMNLCKNDFIYLDPPYALENQRIFTQYCNHTFGLNDIERLEEVLEFIENKQAHFVLSYADTPDIRKRFNKYLIKRVSVQRNIAGFSEFRRKSGELIITNIK